MPPDVRRIQFGADHGRESQVMISPELPRGQLLLILQHAMLAHRLDDCLGQSEGPA
jgi:hypothetical protein